MFLLLVEDELGLALLDAEELIDARVHFLADLLARLQAHDHQLGVLAGEQYPAEVGVLQGFALDRSDVAGHGCTSLPVEAVRQLRPTCPRRCPRASRRSTSSPATSTRTFMPLSLRSSFPSFPSGKRHTSSVSAHRRVPPPLGFDTS